MSDTAINLFLSLLVASGQGYAVPKSELVRVYEDETMICHMVTVDKKVIECCQTLEKGECNE